MVAAIIASARTVEVIPEFLYDAPEQVQDLLLRISKGYFDVLLAQDVPAHWGVGFAGTLALLGLTCAMLSDRGTWIAAAVAACAVIGVPHPDFGEAVVAVVVRKSDATVDGAAITAELKTKIANFKVPKAVFIVADLPRNTMGKVQKNLLREQHRGLFG